MRRLLLGVLLAPLCYGGGDALWQYVHPQARAIAGADWKKVAVSDIGRLLQGELAKMGLKNTGPASVFDSIDRGTTSSLYPGVEICRGPPGSGGQPMELAILSHTLLIIGDRGSVRAAIDHAVPPGGPLMVRARHMAGENEIWAVMSTPTSAFAGGALPQAELP